MLRAESAANGILDTALMGDGFRRAEMILEDGDLALPVKLNGVATSLLVSSATTSTVLDRNNLAKFNLTARDTMLPLYTGAGKAHEHLGLVRVKSLEFHDIVLADFEAAVFDGTAIKRTHSARPDGLFGFAHLKNLGAFIDCSRKILYVNPGGRHRELSRRLTVSMPREGFVCVPMHVNDVGQYQVDCQVNGRHIPFVVEVGQAISIIKSGEAAKHGVSVGKPFARSESAGHLQTTLSRSLVNTFSVGYLQCGATAMASGDTVHNLLGFDFLNAHRAIVDCGGNYLYVR